MCASARPRSRCICSRDCCMASTTDRPNGSEDGGEESLRLFVALSLPPDAREALGAWQRAVLKSHAELRGVEVATLHATLCFLGHRTAREIDLITGACRAVAGAGAARAPRGARGRARGSWRDARAGSSGPLDGAGGGGRVPPRVQAVPGTRHGRAAATARAAARSRARTATAVADVR